MFFRGRGESIQAHHWMKQRTSWLQRRQRDKAGNDTQCNGRPTFWGGQDSRSSSKCANKLLICPGDKLDNQPITDACLNARLLTSAILVLNTFLDKSYSFWATVYKTVRPMLSDRCLSVCLWRWCIVAKRLDGSRWNLARRYSLGHIVLDRDPS